MSVYVDELFKCGGISPKWPYDEACHMTADSVDELHAFAAKLGLKREWFQQGRILPHYDLTRKKRAQAVRLGAVEVTGREMVQLMRRQTNGTL